MNDAVDANSRNYFRQTRDRSERARFLLYDDIHRLVRYCVPREATHEDIAESLDLSAGTVGEHLRKIEATVTVAIGP